MLHHPVYKLLHRSELAFLNQVELVDKVDKVLERCVEMRLFLQRDDVIKVGVVDVCVDTKQALEDRLGDGDEVAGKCNT